MKILITGANGMVARATATHCRAIGDHIVALTRTELDIGFTDNVFSAIEALQPDVIINCAAFTDVDGAETRVEESIRANAYGPETLAIAAKNFSCILVTISTDYVFDGDKDGFYTQDDTPNPQSVYAKSKLDGEARVASANSDAIIVRSGWIYGEHGTNFLSVMHKLLAEGKSIKAISDSYGTPTYAHDLAVRLRELASLRTNGIFHATNNGPGTSYLEFAQTVADIGGFDRTLIEPISKDSLKRPAARPANSRLACLRSSSLGLRQMPKWKQALTSFLDSSKK